MPDLLDAISVVRKKFRDKSGRKEIPVDEIGEALLALSPKYECGVDIGPASIGAEYGGSERLMRKLRSWLIRNGGDELTAFHARGEKRPHILLTKIQHQRTLAFKEDIKVFESLPDYPAIQQRMLNQMIAAKVKKSADAEIYGSQPREEYIEELFRIRLRGFSTLFSKAAPNVRNRDAFVAVLQEAELVAWEQNAGFAYGDLALKGNYFHSRLHAWVQYYTDSAYRRLESAKSDHESHGEMLSTAGEDRMNGAGEVQALAAARAEVNGGHDETALTVGKGDGTDGHTLTWEDIEIRFTSEQRLQIFVRGKPDDSMNFADMGFEDHRGGGRKPTLAWFFLVDLSQTGGIYPAKQISGNQSIQKRAQELRDLLAARFHIAGDPLPFREGTGYKSRFKISRSPGFNT